MCHTWSTRTISTFRLRSEQGVPGLIAFLGIIVSTVAYTVSAWRRTDEVGRGLLVAGMRATIALLVHGLFDAELYFSTLAPLVFLAPALLLWVASGIKSSRTQ